MHISTVYTDGLEHHGHHGCYDDHCNVDVNDAACDNADDDDE